MLQLKPRQLLVVEAMNDPVVDTIVLIGAVGTGKTDIAAHIVLSIADSFPSTYWPVIRLNLSTSRKTVIPSYLTMADRMGLIEDVDYTFNKSELKVEFPNGSVVPFVEADITKDRDGKKIRGINATGNHIDEPDELDPSIFIQATSRRGRRNESGQPSVSILSMNPTDGHLKALYYDRWKAGTLPPNIRVIEFDINDSWQTKKDIDSLKQNPEWWTQRYLYNNWDYSDESMSLFKSRHWATAMTDNLEPNSQRSVGYDVARNAKGDRSIRALGYDLTLADLNIVKDKEVLMELPDQAKWLIQDAEDSGYGVDDAAIDAVGLGQGMVDDIRSEGYNPEEFKAGAAPDPRLRLPSQDTASLNFDNLRSQLVFLFARGVEIGDIRLFKGCPFLNDLFKEAAAHQFETTNKVFKVEGKDHVKKRLGHSPDFFDAVLIWLYKALRPVESFTYDEDEEDETIMGGLSETQF